jgi:hypothetical protein
MRPRLHIGSVCNQKFDHALMPSVSGLKQRRITIDVRHIWIGTLFEERLCDSLTPANCGNDERCEMFDPVTIQVSVVVYQYFGDGD